LQSDFSYDNLCAVISSKQVCFSYYMQGMATTFGTALAAIRFVVPYYRTLACSRRIHDLLDTKIDEGIEDSASTKDHST
jgi:hypothetical protein